MSIAVKGWRYRRITSFYIFSRVHINNIGQLVCVYFTLDFSHFYYKNFVDVTVTRCSLVHLMPRGDRVRFFVFIFPAFPLISIVLPLFITCSRLARCAWSSGSVWTVTGIARATKTINNVSTEREHGREVNVLLRKESYQLSGYWLNKNTEEHLCGSTKVWMEKLFYPEGVSSQTHIRLFPKTDNRQVNIDPLVVIWTLDLFFSQTYLGPLIKSICRVYLR